MPLEDRVRAFADLFHAGESYPNMSFFEWHHRLTGSCEMGRRQFAKDRGIDLAGRMTPEEFIKLTRDAYGGNAIRMLEDFYPSAKED